MKRIGNLYEQIISVENLELADRKARKGKTKSYGVRLHDRTRERDIQVLHAQLANHTFKTSEYSVFKVYEPKEREIHRLPYFPDRIVHHAVMNILEPIWTRTFTYNTYSCIKHRGIEACAERVDRIIEHFKDADHLYCLKLDIKHYYPSIKHHVLKRLVRRRIKDPEVLWLLDEIIDSAEGLPIGNYLSQYLANLYLCYFMHWVNEELPGRIQEETGQARKPDVPATEYADDIVLYSDSKEVLHAALRLITEYIEKDLELRLKENYQIFPMARNRYDRSGRALDYVGYKFYRDQKLIRKSIKQNFCRATARLSRRPTPVELKQYKQEVAPWLGWAFHSNSRNLLHKLLNSNYYDNCVLRPPTRHIS